MPVLPLQTIRKGQCTCQPFRVEPCVAPGKHPIKKFAPNGLKDATTDLDVIRSWWTLRPRANIGIRLDGYAGIDLDVGPKSQAYEYMGKLAQEDPDILDTWTQFTPSGGEHLIYELRPGYKVRNSIGRLAPGIDTRGEDGYIVAAPSMGLVGLPYRWRIDHGPMDPPNEALKLPDVLERELLKHDLLVAPGLATEEKRREIKLEDDGRDSEKADFVDFYLNQLPITEGPFHRWVRHYVFKAWLGHRNPDCFDLALQLRDGGLTFEEALPYMAMFVRDLAAKENTYSYVKRDPKYTPFVWNEAKRCLLYAYRRPPREAPIARSKIVQN